MLKLQYFGHLIGTADSLEKSLMLRKIEGRGRIGLSEDEMAGSYHQCNGHELGQIWGNCEDQGGLACFSPWGGRVIHNWATEQQEGLHVLSKAFMAMTNGERSKHMN